MMHRLSTPHVIVAACVIFAVALFEAAAYHPARAQSTVNVTIQNFSFQPGTLTIQAGTTVTWTNKDTVSHTSTSDGGVWDSGPIAPNASFSFTFQNAGTFPYHCSIHPTMHGTIIVQAAGTSAPTGTISTTPVGTGTATVTATLVTTPTGTATSIPTGAFPVNPPASWTHAPAAHVYARGGAYGFTFSPRRTQIVVGMRVTWSSARGGRHSVTASSRNWKLNKTFSGRGKVSFVFTKPGTYRYYCRFHPGMTGTIVVRK